MANGIDRIIVGGHIRTLDDAQPVVSALAMSGERIVALGDDDAIRQLADADTVIDHLEGRNVLPGFVDAHIHWQGTAEALHDVRLYDLKSRDEAVRLVAERAKSTPAGEWILGYGWSQDTWEDRRFPTAHDLDTVVRDHPVFLRARSGHAAWVNSLALRIGGIDASIADPVGGQIQRDDQGEPTGILFEWTAMALVGDRIPPVTIHSLVRKMNVAQDIALSMGMTGIHDLDWRNSFVAIQQMREQGRLGLRVVKHINHNYFEAMLDLGVRQGFGDGWIRLGNLKIFADGALGPRTAAMVEPYDGEPDNYGVVVTDKEELLEYISRASASGFASAVHAIGDRAIHDVLDVYQEVRRQEAERGERRSLRRHRIEHVQLIHENDVTRLAELGIIASMQPIHATSDYLIADRYWGARCERAYNPRLQLDQGVVVAFGSDAPYDIMGPIIGIHAAVTRRRADGSPGEPGWYPAARLTIDEAVRAYTLSPAYAAGVEDRLGRLAPGYLADLVVLDRDLYQCPPDELLSVHAVGTMVGGDWRYRQF